MAVIRLDSDERRKAIVRAAVPLFARKGFAGTTTRELAEAAGISEALLFKHFPSKQSLYREIRQLGCEGDPALEALASLSPSTATLICMLGFMVRHFLGVAQSERGELDSRLRLVAHSFLEDGEYARELFEAVSERVLPLFEAGRLTVPVDRTFPLEQAADAYDHFSAGKKFGKVILTVP